MRVFDILRHRLRSLLSRQSVEQELEEELAYHLQREMEENAAAGISSSNSAARPSMLGLEQRKEECRDARGLNLIDHLRKDLAFAIRQLRKDPGFTCTAMFVLALGISASLAIFAFVDASLIKPLPYRDSAHLVALYETDAMFPRCNLSYPDYLDWKQRNRVFSSLEVYQRGPYVLTTSSGAQPVRGARVSAGFFRTLGVAPAFGRDFRTGEDWPGAPRLVLLSYATWQQQYAGRPDVLGQTAVLDGYPHTIVGVLPREFHFAPAGRPEFWTAMQPTRPFDMNRKSHTIYGVARLSDSMSFQAALSNLTSIAADLEVKYPESNRGRGASIEPLAEIITGNIHPMLMVLLGGSGLLLLISAVNVAGLVLLRSQSRKREIAVRTALGASSGRLIAQFTTEALALAAGGGGLGIALAGCAIRLLLKLLPDDFRLSLPFLDELALNGHVLLAGVAVAAMAATLLAIPPCSSIRSSDLRGGLAEASRGSAGTVWRRVGSNLVVLELATAMVLLAGAGLLSKSLYLLMRADLGIEPDRLVTVDVFAPETAYSTMPKVVAIEKQIVDDVANLPGVKSVGVAENGVPLSGNGNTTWFHIPGRPWHGEHFDAPERDISPGYFSTLGAKMLRGRAFHDSDRAGAPQVTIVNRSFARKYYPNEDPVGKQIVEHSGSGVTIPIVGLVDDIREGPLDQPVPPVLYFPFDQRADSDFSLVVRAAGAEQNLLPAIAAAIRKIDPGIVTSDGATMLHRIQDSESAYMHRSMAWLVGAFAAVALLLSVVGLYGVAAYSVSQRNREIGIRTALGATRGSIYRLILSEAGRLIGFGTAAGIAGSIAAGRFIRGLLFGVQSSDVSTLAAVATVLAAVALLASLIPARRAASVHPMESLRAE